MTSAPEHQKLKSATLAGGHTGTEETGPGSGKGKNANGPVSIGFTLAGACGHCGGQMVRLLRCGCTHLSLVHEVRKDGTRGKCASGGGLKDCGCERFEETP